jgi:hypothetical protein
MKSKIRGLRGRGLRVPVADQYQAWQAALRQLGSRTSGWATAPVGTSAYTSLAIWPAGS